MLAVLSLYGHALSLVKKNFHGVVQYLKQCYLHQNQNAHYV